MKNKGFTLVELLAVIVVLAIISIITIPMIGNVIDESKKKALEVSANGLVEATNYFTISNDGVYEFVFDENKKGETIKGEKLDYKGSIEGTGKLYIDEEGDISLCLVDDKYYVYKNYNSGIYVGEVKDNSCIIGYDVLTNKYVAMLDDGSGQVSNVYSKEEVNNLIDNLQEQISENTTSINTLSDMVNNNKEIINNLNSNLDDVNNHIKWKQYGTYLNRGESMNIEYILKNANEIMLIYRNNVAGYDFYIEVIPVDFINTYLEYADGSSIGNLSGFGRNTTGGYDSQMISTFVGNTITFANSFVNVQVIDYMKLEVWYR